MGTELINLQNILGGVWVKVGVGLGGGGVGLGGGGVGWGGVGMGVVAHTRNTS